MSGAVDGQRQAWNPRAEQAQRVVKMSAGEHLQRGEVGVQRTGPPPHSRLPMAVRMCGATLLLGLFRQSLCQTRRDAKAVTSPVNSGEVC